MTQHILRTKFINGIPSIIEQPTESPLMLGGTESVANTGALIAAERALAFGDPKEARRIIREALGWSV